MAEQTSTGSPQPTLDHIVILVSASDLLQLPDRLKDSFVVSPGGTHAGGQTFNKLILFEDGVYIELIAFAEGISPEERAKHRWGRQRENTIVDWAYTLPHESDFGAVQQRVRDAKAGLTYKDPVPGGRTRPDGVVLKWAIGAPQDENGNEPEPGILPFWCLDRTPRSNRVPYQEDKAQTQHPSGARGVSRVRLNVPQEQLSALQSVYDAIHDVDRAARGEDEWTFSTPDSSAKARHTLGVASESGPKIKLAFQGSVGSPSFLEILPGIVVKFEA
ncbi:Glyoxalase-like_dom domain-containing protein [Trichoderma simmonsii]|uniref:Glyoxalase-like_dom domain-containing protein n=1 Tax=Trichoderma simmonsii TaxID=1491479 RepID=A0A8G0LDA2_9HYPO|nr:Glyoxalase-like_dom domain-containing protein [Trichoderma simmonsii]